jgi:hypothetical protein
VRLNEHLEHPEDDVVFRHACKMAPGGDRFETPDTGLFFRQVVSGLVIPFPETNTVSGRDSVRLEPSILLVVEPGFI